MAATASTKGNLGIVREFVDVVFNGRDYDRLTDFQSADYVQHGPMAGMELHGNDESLETMRMFHEAFSDLEAVEEFAFTDGDYVCTRYTYRGTHDGELMGLAPTDVECEVPGIVINRLDDGRIAEAWPVVDFLGLLQQVGAVPAIEQLGD